MLFNTLLFCLFSTSFILVACRGEGNYTFAIIPKSVSDPYFMDVIKGCEDKAQELENISCIALGPTSYDEYKANPDLQADILDGIVQEGLVHGVSIAVQYISEKMEASINNAVDAGIPVLTYDSDAPNTKRSAYIGTDNLAFGDQLGKVLLQISPEGGDYAIITGFPGKQLNTDLRVAGMDMRLSSFKSKWIPIETHIVDSKNDIDTALEDMVKLAEANPNLRAILSCCGWAMYKEKEWKSFIKTYRNITLVNGDSNAQQLVLLNQGYGDGLVGQLPYEMGTLSIDKLLDLKRGSTLNQQTIFGTTLLQHLRVPLNLPSLDVDNNFIANYATLGYALFTTIAAVSLGCAIWVFMNRNHAVVKASQPMFLLPLCLGVFITGLTIIPLTFDDKKDVKAASKACMSIPWLAVFGFTLTYSMLFSKIWRVNQIVRNSEQCRRVVVKAKDVLGPFAIFMAANSIVLICWTAVSPLVYVRHYHPGTDDWNRILSTYGICQSTEGSATTYFVVLFLINFIGLVITNVQAYQARKITTDFSESKYIALALAFILQAITIGVPVTIMSNDDPKLMFTISVILIAVSTLATLGFIFIPKMVAKNKHDEETKRMSSVEVNQGNIDPSNRKPSSRLRTSQVFMDINSTRTIINASGRRSYVSGLNIPDGAVPNLIRKTEDINSSVVHNSEEKTGENSSEIPQKILNNKNQS